MKKLFAVIALAAVMVSCNSKKKDEKKDSTTDTTSTTTTTTTTTTTDNTTTTTAIGDIPKFADAEVQKYVNDYTIWVTTYVDAYKTKDMSKISKVSTEATDWAGKTQSVIMKLVNNPEESTKFSNYMTKLSEAMTAAVQMK